MVTSEYLDIGREMIGNPHFPVGAAVDKYTLCMLTRVYGCVDRWMVIGSFSSLRNKCCHSFGSYGNQQEDMD